MRFPQGTVSAADHPDPSLEEMMKVKDIMTEGPACCTGQDTLERAAHLMEEYDCGCIPVVDGADNNFVVGVVTDRDIAIRGIAHGLNAGTRVQDIMTEGVCCCSSDADVRDVEQLMASRQIRRVVVVDDDGCCVGMVAQADLARAAENRRDVTDEEVGRVVQAVSDTANDNRRPRDRDRGEGRS